MLTRSTLSIVVPIHNEQETLPELYERLVEAITAMGFAATEVLLISDGSTDDSDRLIAEYVRRDARFRGLFLTRNFGHQAAVSIGLEQCRGDVVAIVDGDLQDPPLEIRRLIEAIQNGADVAYGVRRRRKEGVLKRVAYAGFYRLLRAMADIEIPLDTGDFCCMRRCVVDAMLKLPERQRFVRGLRAWVGFKQVGVTYERSARFAGTPSYTWRKLLQLAYNGLFSFSTLPVRVMQRLGILISLAAIGVAACYVVMFFARPELFPQGFATIAVSIWLLAGVQLFFTGILGEYVVRTFDEVRGRPFALLREQCGTGLGHSLSINEEQIEGALGELLESVGELRAMTAGDQAASSSLACEEQRNG
ncbi:MAG: glycosyltransferase family 2 protein [Planctomycetales bacterium]|nr:glycosyltransferase family 2 protein [Planctomycetales bacterium]MCA9169151.1 glycosyltransferase family 2 protein [Planctomycetales bacterium]